jgi:hypothetical protein
MRGYTDGYEMYASGSGIAIFRHGFDKPIHTDISSSQTRLPQRFNSPVSYAMPIVQVKAITVSQTEFL